MVGLEIHDCDRPLVVRINEIEKPETDVPHRTGFVARLLAEIGERAPEEYIKSTEGLFDGLYADFDTPIVCPGGAEIFAWDSTRKVWPRPFYIRRWVEGPNLAVLPRASYFQLAGKALRRFHGIRFKRYYTSFKAVAKEQPSSAKDLFAIGKALEVVEPLLPPLTISALTRLEDDPEGVIAGLVSNTFFGNNILIDNLGRVRVPDWERAGIGDVAQDFFPLKYWTMVDKRSGWFMPDASLFAAFCTGLRGKRDPGPRRAPRLAVPRGSMAAAAPGRRPRAAGHREDCASHIPSPISTWAACAGCWMPKLRGSPLC